MIVDDENTALRAGVMVLSALALVAVLGIAYKAVAGGTQIDPNAAQKLKKHGVRGPGARSGPQPNAVAPLPAGSDPATAIRPAPPTPEPPQATHDENMERWMEALRNASKPKPTNPETTPKDPPKDPPKDLHQK